MQRPEWCRKASSVSTSLVCAPTGSHTPQCSTASRRASACGRTIRRTAYRATTTQTSGSDMHVYARPDAAKSASPPRWVVLLHSRLLTTAVHAILHGRGGRPRCKRSLCLRVPASGEREGGAVQDAGLLSLARPRAAGKNRRAQARQTPNVGYSAHNLSNLSRERWCLDGLTARPFARPAKSGWVIS